MHPGLKSFTHGDVLLLLAVGLLNGVIGHVAEVVELLNEQVIEAVEFVFN